MTAPVAAPPESSSSFHVRLDNFDGPFDLLLQLISQHRMDITDIALHRVTDEFIVYTKTLGERWNLERVTSFLVVAATLLDLKAARLLPDAEVENPEDLALLEARDLLFARLLAYRAFQQVAGMFRELEATALHRYPRAVTLEERYLGLLPEVQIGLDASEFAEMAAAVFRPKPPPVVSLGHLHGSTVSVSEHTARLRELLADYGSATFTELVAGCNTMEIVARFLGLLNLYRQAEVVFEQDESYAPLLVRLTDGADGGIATDEEYQ